MNYREIAKHLGIPENSVGPILAKDWRPRRRATQPDEGVNLSMIQNAPRFSSPEPGRRFIEAGRRRGCGPSPGRRAQGQGLAGAVGLDPGILAPAVDDPGLGVDQDATAKDIDDPVDRDQGPRIQLQRRGQIVLEAGDGDLDEQADVLQPQGSGREARDPAGRRSGRPRSPVAGHWSDRAAIVLSGHKLQPAGNRGTRAMLMPWPRPTRAPWSWPSSRRAFRWRERPGGLSWNQTRLEHPGEEARWSGRKAPSTAEASLLRKFGRGGHVSVPFSQPGAPGSGRGSIAASAPSIVPTATRPPQAAASEWSMMSLCILAQARASSLSQVETPVLDDLRFLTPFEALSTLTIEGCFPD